ncbi:MAG: class I SAM-dependent methyltransferase [Pikeienuella sp.]
MADEGGRPVLRFRARRGQRLGAKIRALAARLGRPVRVIDLGGSPDYWQSVGLADIAEITLVNLDAAEMAGASGSPFRVIIGDARDLSEVATGSFDLAHSNSAIEHVGGWPEMVRMAAEMKRVAPAGWLQTPAWEFPLEPHFRVPFMHWFGQPMRRAMLRLSPVVGWSASLDVRRRHVDRINLLSYAEVRALFPEAEIWVERVALLPKSYVAIW